MKAFMKAAAALMLMTAVMMTAGCTKDPNNGGNNKFPAPKKEENKTRLTGISFPRESELFMIF